MKKDIEKLIEELKQKNRERNDKIQSYIIDDYDRTYYVHTYNLTIDFIRKLESLLK